MRARTKRFAAGLVTAAIATGAFAACEPDAVRSTLNRPADPVVVTGDQVSALSGVQADRVVAFSASSDGWAQLPVQVDEQVETTMDQVYGLPADTTFYGSSINVPVTVYADPETFVGADPDPTLDALDEVAFMARDAGGPADDLDAPAGTTGGGVEVRLEDPNDPDATGYVYLFESDGTLDPGAGKQYVEYDFNLDSGDYRETYGRTSGPNPEDSTVTGLTYTAHFADRWLMDGLTITHGDRPGVDLIDRMKFDLRILCLRNEDTFNAEEGAFITNRVGPVRALRSYVGSNSGPNTQNTYAFYDTTIDQRSDLRVHAISNVRSHADFSREAVGMTFQNPDVPDGVTIDGQPDDVPATLPSWWTATGDQGAMALSAWYDTNVAADPEVWYEDSFSPSDWQCTGDDEAVGDAGVLFNGAVECTDPGLGCDGHLRGGSRWVFGPSALSPEVMQDLAEDGLAPLEVSVSEV